MILCFCLLTDDVRNTIFCSCSPHRKGQFEFTESPFLTEDHSPAERNLYGMANIVHKPEESPMYFKNPITDNEESPGKSSDFSPDYSSLDESKEDLGSEKKNGMKKDDIEIKKDENKENCNKKDEISDEISDEIIDMFEVDVAETSL